MSLSIYVCVIHAYIHLARGLNPGIEAKIGGGGSDGDGGGGETGLSRG